jgi:hypothetical protein
MDEGRTRYWKMIDYVLEDSTAVAGVVETVEGDVRIDVDEKMLVRSAREGDVSLEMTDGEWVLSRQSDL